MRAAGSHTSIRSSSQVGTATKATRGLQASYRPSIIGEDGDSIEQASKNIRTDDTPQYPIHDILVMHRLATSDPEDDHSNHGEGDAWWGEVEGVIEIDRKADVGWWGEADSPSMLTRSAKPSSTPTSGYMRRMARESSWRFHVFGTRNA